MLSRTANSGRPTSTVFGSPAEASTSASTGTASMPTRANVFSFASISGRLRTSRLATGGSCNLLRADSQSSFGGLRQQQFQVLAPKVADETVVGVDDGVRQVALALLQLQHFLLDRVTSDEAV